MSEAHLVSRDTVAIAIDIAMLSLLLSLSNMNAIAQKLVVVVTIVGVYYKIVFAFASIFYNGWLLFKV